jgi:hypothetical protein
VGYDAGSGGPPDSRTAVLTEELASEAA